jgi:hypothetical protein
MRLRRLDAETNHKSDFPRSEGLRLTSSSHQIVHGGSAVRRDFMPCAPLATTPHKASVGRFTIRQIAPWLSANFQLELIGWQ